MKTDTAILAKFKVANRSKMIEMARSIAAKHFGETDLSNFSSVSVQKKADEYLVHFRANVTFSAITENTTRDSFSVHISSSGHSVDPKDGKYLTTYPAFFKKIAALFRPSDSVSVQVLPDTYKVTVSRAGGGAEGYSINKQTFEKKMEWHEHPNPANRGKLVDSLTVDLKTGTPVPEQWIVITE